MNKDNVRRLKTHFGVRWRELRHLQKTGQHQLCFENKFVLSNVLPGPVLALDCLGEVYQGLLDVDTQPLRTYSTLLMINNLEFKYMTPRELSQLIVCRKNLAERLIVNFNFFFLMYDRLALTPEQLLISLEQQLELDFNVTKKMLFTTITNHGFGNTFLVLDQKHA